MLHLTFEILFLCFVARTTYLEIVFELFRYPFRIWMTSVLVGPVLLMLSMGWTRGWSGAMGYDLIQFYSVTVLLAGFMSIPSFLFLWLCYYSMLVKWKWSTLAIRGALLGISLLSCISLFAYFSFGDGKSFWHTGDWVLVGAFALPLAFGVIVYKLKQ